MTLEHFLVSYASAAKKYKRIDHSSSFENDEDLIRHSKNGWSYCPLQIAGINLGLSFQCSWEAYRYLDDQELGREIMKAADNIPPYGEWDSVRFNSWRRILLKLSEG